MHNSIKNRIDRSLQVRLDKGSGFYRHKRFGHILTSIIRNILIKMSTILWVFENLFFNHYLPKDNDVVVDLGTGYGDEVLYVAVQSKILPI